MKKLPAVLLGLVIINVLFVHCAFGMGMNLHCPFSLSHENSCSGYGTIQAIAHHLSNMSNSTLAVLPILIGFVSLFSLAIILIFEDLTLSGFQYSLLETEKPTFTPRRHIFKWLSVIRQRDPESLIWTHSIG